MRSSSASGPTSRYLTGYPAMPLERLTMLVIARRTASRPSSCRASRRRRRRARPRPTAIAGRDLGGDRRRVRARGRAAASRRRVATPRRAWTGRRGRPVGAPPAPRSRRRCPTRRVRARVARSSARCGSSRTPTRSHCCAWPPTPPTASLPRSPPAAWSGGPRRTSRTKSVSGSSPRAMTRRRSRSSGPGRTPLPRTTAPPTG